MDRRGVLATFSATIGGGGLAALIGVTALPANSPYEGILIGFGFSGLVVSCAVLVLMYLTARAPYDGKGLRQSIEIESIPLDLDAGQRAIRVLRNSRDRASLARRRWFGFEAHHRAYNELTAAIRGVQKELGVGGLLSLSHDSDEPTFRDLLLAYIAYVDTYLPLLENGQMDIARKVASKFSLSYE